MEVYPGWHGQVPVDQGIRVLVDGYLIQSLVAIAPLQEPRFN